MTPDNDHAIDHSSIGLHRLTIQPVFNEVSLFTFSEGTHGFDITVPKNYLKIVGWLVLRIKRTRLPLHLSQHLHPSQPLHPLHFCTSLYTLWDFAPAFAPFSPLHQSLHPSHPLHLCISHFTPSLAFASLLSPSHPPPSQNFGAKTQSYIRCYMLFDTYFILYKLHNIQH